MVTNKLFNKKNCNGLKNVISLILLLFIGMLTVNATSQHEILRWEFETCSGSIIFDNTDNNNNGILQNGAKFDNSPVKNGLCSIYLDGANDFVSTLNSFNTPNQLSFSIWFNSIDTNNWNILDLGGGLEDYRVYYNYATKILQLWYYDDLGNYINYNLENFNIPTNKWINLIISFDTENNVINYWRDGVKILDNITLVGGINKDLSVKTLKLGTNKDNLDYFKGNLDSLRLFDFVLNDSQVYTLYNFNTIDLMIDDDSSNNINSTINNTIIKSYYPNLNNNSIMFLDKIQVELYELSSCDLYIDNSLTEQYYNILAFNYVLDNLELGEHTYLVYCYNIDNGVKNYDISDTISFNLFKPSKIIDFYIYNKEGKLMTEYDDLYLVTPCFSSSELTKYNVPDKEVYIQPLINGLASFNLSYNSVYDFCLLKGKVNSKENTYSLNYDLPGIQKQTHLGKLYVTNSTYTYSLKIDETDIYPVTSPEFWGKTWSSLFQLIIGTIIGGLIIFIGLVAKNDKLMMIGGLIIAISMGVGITSFLGVIF